MNTFFQFLRYLAIDYHDITYLSIFDFDKLIYSIKKLPLLIDNKVIKK